VAAVMLGLEAWMVVEAVLLWPRARGILEDPLPPLAEVGRG
jgi:carbon starvation protein